MERPRTRGPAQRRGPGARDRLAALWTVTVYSGCRQGELLGTRQTAGDYAGLRLVAAAIGRSAPIGGFDLVNNRPRATRLAAPAGSVYWFEQTADGAAARAFDRLDGACLSDEMASIGFGQCYGGVW